MLESTRGIVFSTTEYGETSLIARIYTEQFGLQSYIIGSVRKKHAKTHSGIFQPLTPVELLAYHKKRPAVQRIKEIRPDPLLTGIPFSMTKSSMILFLDEILIKSIREEEANPGLFEFLYKSIEWLDGVIDPNPDFHLIFLLRLTRYLGFAPTPSFDEDKTFFDFREGSFLTGPPDHPNYISGKWPALFARLMDAKYAAASPLTVEERKQLLIYVLEFYQLHIEGFGNIKSYKVLEQVWE